MLYAVMAWLLSTVLQATIFHFSNSWVISSLDSICNSAWEIGFFQVEFFVNGNPKPPNAKSLPSSFEAHLSSAATWYDKVIWLAMNAVNLLEWEIKKKKFEKLTKICFFRWYFRNYVCNLSLSLSPSLLSVPWSLIVSFSSTLHYPGYQGQTNEREAWNERSERKADIACLKLEPRLYRYLMICLIIDSA